MKQVLAAVVAVAALGAVSAITALAAHESNNALTFAPVAGSPSPDASGSGVINYVKGISGEEPDTAWTSSFHFTGLMPDTAYSVAVRGRFADAAAFSDVCTFTTKSSGAGSCASDFIGLQRLAIVQLRLGGEDGMPVLQATRQSVAPGGPGEIVSRGGCREPDQAGSTCEAPGLQP